MITQEAINLGQSLALLVQSGHIDKAYELLAPILAERTSFRLLDKIGKNLGITSIKAVNNFLERIAAEKLKVVGWLSPAP